MERKLTFLESKNLELSKKLNNEATNDSKEKVKPVDYSLNLKAS